jgi:poly-beta-hydroxybutyrate-responsive repressor
VVRDTKTGKQTSKTNNGHSPEANNPSGFQPRLTGDLLSSSLLAYLRRWNAYGYQLVQELTRSGLPSFDSTTVYRTLRQLERAGLVSSFWDTSESGPARRMYSLTKAGETFLDLWLDLFGRYQKVLHSALDSLENLDRTADGGAVSGASSRRSKEEN